jgi:hypothetical protein
MKLKNGAIEVLMPSTLNESTFFSKEPFLIFAQSTFMDEAIYGSFIRDLEVFYKTVLFDGNDREKKRLALRLNNNNRLILSKNRLVRDFVGLFQRREFKQWFRRTHEPFYELGFLGGIFTSSKWDTFLFSTVNRIALKLFNKKAFSIYTASIEFSFLPTGASIEPHTDSHKKRMALVFYTPFKTLNDQMRSTWGTQFWRAKSGIKPMRSWLTSTQTSDEQLKVFKEGHELAFQVEYQPNTINGFIKNDLSWHSVSENTFEQDRTAIVINVMELSSLKTDFEISEEIASVT